MLQTLDPIKSSESPSCRWNKDGAQRGYIDIYGNMTVTVLQNVTSLSHLF